MKLDEKLVRLRKEKGLTQLELAEAVKVSRQAVSKWEVGEATPSTEKLLGLSEVYGVQVDYLLNDKEDREEVKLIPQEPKESPCDISPDKKRARSLRWLAAVLAILILVAAIVAAFAANDKDNSAYLQLGEVQGEEVVSDRNFSVGW